MRSIPRPARLALALASLLGACGIASAAEWQENVDPENSGLQYAWSENGGWLNAEPQGDGSVGLYIPEQGGLLGYLWSENFGWINVNCLTLDTCGDVAFAVNAAIDVNDPQSIALTGYGWGENIGWINFSCENQGSCLNVDFGVRIDRASGLAFGYAWGENVGWISFGCLTEDSCAQQNFGVQAAVTPLPDSIFQDGFEPSP